MGFIQNEANKFYDDHIDDELDKFDDYFLRLKFKVGELYPEDQSEFYKVILDRAIKEREHHKNNYCKSPGNCDIIRGADKLEYHLKREILHTSFGNPSTEGLDNFSEEEKSNITQKIDDILVKLKELGLGHEILYEEIQELKGLQNLNKKTFRQVVLGKLGDVLMGETAGQIADVLEKNNLSLTDIYSFITGAVKKSLPPSI